MVATYIIDYDRENLASLVLAVNDLRRKADELEQAADALAEKYLQKLQEVRA